ncbi:MAG: SRPBCC family protein [Actinomycetota bacterium]|nr:SRPBCC family protein [Actinomycetota bacterium]
MADQILERSQLVPTSPDVTFAFFADPWNLEAITPPWLRFQIVEAPERLTRGSLLRYRLSLFGIPVRWRTEITDWDPPHGFVDEQLRGPYRIWIHEHRLEPNAGGTVVHDRVRYRIPLGPLGRLAGRLFVRRWLDDIFDFRAARIAERLTRDAPTPTLR